MPSLHNVFFARIGNIHVDDDLGNGIRFWRGFCLTNNHDVLFDQMSASLRTSFREWLVLCHS